MLVKNIEFRLTDPKAKVVNMALLDIETRKLSFTLQMYPCHLSSNLMQKSLT